MENGTRRTGGHELRNVPENGWRESAVLLRFSFKLRKTGFRKCRQEKALSGDDDRATSR